MLRHGIARSGTLKRFGKEDNEKKAHAAEGKAPPCQICSVEIKEKGSVSSRTALRGQRKEKHTVTKGRSGSLFHQTGASSGGILTFRERSRRSGATKEMQSGNSEESGKRNEESGMVRA